MTTDEKKDELLKKCHDITNCHKCVFWDKPCVADAEEEKDIKELYDEYIKNEYSLNNNDEIEKEKNILDNACLQIDCCKNCIFNKDYCSSEDKEGVSKLYKKYIDNGCTLESKIEESVPVKKNKHPYNSTQIISIKRKGRKLYMRYEDGNKVYKVSASCHKYDEFNIIDGMGVLRDKLSDRISNEGNGNFKFIAIDNDDFTKLVTKGMIYNCVNGKIMFDNNHLSCGIYKDFDDFIKSNRQFIEIVMEVKGEVNV